MLKNLKNNAAVLTFKRIIIRMKNHRRGVIIGTKCNIALGSLFEGNNCIAAGTSFSGTIGFGSYIGQDCSIHSTIGRYSCIGPRVTTVNGMHPTETFVSIHPCFYSTKKQAGFTFVSENLFSEETPIATIGNDVWIGANVTIVNGAKIGDGAIIAAGAVVTKDVPPYTIVGGVPSKVIGSRFDEKSAQYLEIIQWWGWNVDTIRERACDFTDIKKFIEKYAKEIAE
jgi:acetyltransferase-like isoleucine patch superfamily enzyme